MAKLTLEKAKVITKKHIQAPHLIAHSAAVSAAMGALAEKFNGDADYWAAIGYLHDVDYEKYPNEHLAHTRELIEGEVDEEDIRAILSHGFGICTDVKPETDMEKCLFTVDELTGIVMAASKMRPTGISDMEVKSAMKKFKDKAFAAKCDRELIRSGCEMLNMELSDILAYVIDGMRARESEWA